MLDELLLYLSIRHWRDEPEEGQIILGLGILIVFIGCTYMFVKTREPKYMGYGVGIIAVLSGLIWLLSRYESKV